MKQKIWCLINKKTGKIIKVGVTSDNSKGTDGYAVGFDTKKGLLAVLNRIEYDEKIKMITFEY